MTLNAPRVLFYILAVVIALVSVIAQLANYYSTGSFWLMTVAFVVLALSCVIKGM